MPPCIQNRTAGRRLTGALVSAVLAMAVAPVVHGRTAPPDANRWTFEALEDATYRIDVRIGSYKLVNRPGQPLVLACDIPGAETILDEDGSPAPRYVRIFELPAGRSAEVGNVVLSSSRLDAMSAGAPVWADAAGAAVAPVEASIGRMGGRVFLRIVVSPFRYDPASRTLTVDDRITASIRVGEDPPPRPAAVAPPAQFLDLPASCAVCPVAMPVSVEEGMGGDPEDFAVRRSVTNEVAWKITVSGPGLFRLHGHELEAAGIPASHRDVSRLRIVARDRVIPVWASTSGPMQSNDWIQFYGAAVESAHATNNIYWLATGAPSPAPTPLNGATNGAAPVVTSFWHTVTFAPKQDFAEDYLPTDNTFDHWFAYSIWGGFQSNVVLATPNPVRTGDVHLAYVLYNDRGSFGDDSPTHQMTLSMSAQVLETRISTGQVRVAGSVAASPQLLGSMITTVRVAQAKLGDDPNNFGDAYLQSLQLCYRRQLVGSALPLYFSAPASTASTLRVTSVPTNALWLLDVSDPFNPREVAGVSAIPSGGSFTVSFASTGGCFALFGPSQVRPVTGIERVRFRGLGDTSRQADYLVIAPESFRAPVYRLLRHRYRNGLAVQVATPSDVYHEFGYGLPGPAALRQYIGYAYHHYAGNAPSNVLLVGNGSYDPLNALGTSEPDILPVRMEPAAFRRTASDQWFVTVDGSDLLPDLRLGRVPATNALEVTRFVNKLIAYETASPASGWIQSALLVADKTDFRGDYKGFSEANTRAHLIANGFDELFGILTAYVDDINPVSGVRTAINQEIDVGIQLVNYMGHGGLNTWSDQVPGGVWGSTDAVLRANSVYPVFSVFTCRSGAFHEPARDSLVEAIVLSAGCGTACIGPTALSVQTFAEKIADGYFEGMGPSGAATLGEALAAGFLKLWLFNDAVSELRTYTIFGDPAQRLWGGAAP